MRLCSVQKSKDCRSTPSTGIACGNTNGWPYSTTRPSSSGYFFLRRAHCYPIPPPPPRQQRQCRWAKFVGNRDFCWQHLVLLLQAVVTTGIVTVPQEDCSTGICDRKCPESQGLGTEEYDGLPAMPGRIESLKSLDEAYLTFERGEEAYMTLEKFLDDFYGFFSLDERESIYAFLSMASDTKGADWKLDYSPRNSTAEVYAKATRHIIHQTGMLNIICWLNGKLSKHSWIPWFGPTKLQGHHHAVHEYKKKSLMTFGQPLRVAADRWKLCGKPIYNACNAEVLGVFHVCKCYKRFYLCDIYIKNALSSYAADHSFC